MAQMQCVQHERFEGDNRVDAADLSGNHVWKKSDSSTYMFKKFISGDDFNNANNGFSNRPTMESCMPSSGWQPLNAGYNSPQWTGHNVRFANVNNGSTLDTNNSHVGETTSFGNLSGIAHERGN